MNDKKEEKVDNLINLVENHTRTERHLEQHSDISNRKNLKNAEAKQFLREKQIQNLKNDITDNESNVVSPEEQYDNVEKNYESAKGYLKNNKDHMDEEAIENMQKKQQNREEQMDNLADNE